MDAPDSQAARDDYLAAQIGRLDDELNSLRRSQSETIAAAVEVGIMRAMSNPDLWTQARRAIQQQATQQAGSWLFRAIGALFSKAGWILMAVVAVYTLGGWGAVATLGKSWLAGGGK